MFLLTVATIWALAAITPGPNFLFVVRAALTGSRRIVLSAILGTIAGTACWGLAGWLGIGLLFRAAPAAYLVLKIAGGIYLIVLGLRMVWPKAHPIGASDDADGQTSLTPAKAFRTGLVANLANPKSAIFVSSLFAATLPPAASWHYGASAVVTMVAISGIWYAVVALALSQAPVLRAYRRMRRGLDRATGVIFVGFGGKLAFTPS
ncbi:MAG: LysE family transporter [Bosea sp. (in: a-proteobacteria)]|uniref:LysE family translocator n=1 Tax=Bosea sp. (in: a-proteobacteria) TaxID=1871050 RepID=UPI0027344164|nr:LysE family transporter [Bosea sp. (in: a-proteobacteria)]MDP3258176.1 LysE family transporter [Bosea sp. (in: a-proteobacteria)]MDP3319160.1 LysE family transporter [Bosea sp. (in: a-proteobacteria)]